MKVKRKPALKTKQKAEKRALKKVARTTTVYFDKTKLIKSYNIIYQNDKNSTFKAIHDATDYLNQIKSLNKSAYNNILVSFEEIFLNIASYAYKNKGQIEVRYNFYPDLCCITFIDSGKKFNPLKKTASEIASQERKNKLGGFGIMMVKNMVDDIHYNYKDNKNIITIKKRY